MSEPFIGEIKVISFNFAPKGWAFCDGQVLPISQNQALFAILGTQYGGDGVTTFCLPNLQGRMPIHQGPGYSVGQLGGEVSHALTVNEMPAHSHLAMGASTGGSPSPAHAVWAPSSLQGFAPAPDTTMAPSALGTTGAGQPHENQAPYLVLNFVIALMGIFPSSS